MLGEKSLEFEAKICMLSEKVSVSSEQCICWVKKFLVRVKSVFFGWQVSSLELDTCSLHIYTARSVYVKGQVSVSNERCYVLSKKSVVRVKRVYVKWGVSISSETCASSVGRLSFGLLQPHALRNGSWTRELTRCIGCVEDTQPQQDTHPQHT